MTGVECSNCILDNSPRSTGYYVKIDYCFNFVLCCAQIITSSWKISNTIISTENVLATCFIVHSGHAKQNKIRAMRSIALEWNSCTIPISMLPFKTDAKKWCASTS